MKRTTFGPIAAAVSPDKREAALILDHKALLALRSRLQWLSADPALEGVTDAIKWMSANTSPTARLKTRGGS